MASRKRNREEKESDGVNHFRYEARERVWLRPEDSSSSSSSSSNNNGRMECSSQNELELRTSTSTCSVAKREDCIGKQKLELVGTLPKLVVLDLDKTLWPFYCHEQTAGPYSRFDDHKDAVKCRSPHGAEKVVRLFPGVVDILSCLNQQGSILLSVASRSPMEGPARGILQALGMLEYFCCLEIHRGSKATHFKNISAATGVPYRDMLFFDDDNSNIRTVAKLGACCIRVDKESGLTLAAVQSGIKKYKNMHLARLSLAGWLTSSPPKRTGQSSCGSTEAALKTPDRAT